MWVAVGFLGTVTAAIVFYYMAMLRLSQWEASGASLDLLVEDLIQLRREEGGRGIGHWCEGSREGSARGEVSCALVTILDTVVPCSDCVTRLLEREAKDRFDDAYSVEALQQGAIQPAFQSRRRWATAAAINDNAAVAAAAAAREPSTGGVGGGGADAPLAAAGEDMLWELRGRTFIATESDVANFSPKNYFRSIANGLLKARAKAHAQSKPLRVPLMTTIFDKAARHSQSPIKLADNKERKLAQVRGSREEGGCCLTDLNAISIEM